MREILLAKSAGFCYGVRRAVRMAEEAATDCSSCVMLGSIIHNAHVVEDLGRKGVRRISRPDEVCEGETVIIRSHGEAKAVLEALEARGGRVVNSTCPRVLKIQQLVHRAEEEGRVPLIIGDPDHPEVLGQHHPSVEKPDGAGPGPGAQPPGHSRPGCRDRNHQ